MAPLRRHLIRLSAALILIAVVAGLPAALVAAVGWPLPDHLPTADEITNALGSELSDGMILDLLAVSTWLLWIAATRAIVTEARAALLGRPVRAHLRPAGPLRAAASALISALTLGVVLSAASTASASPALASEQPFAATTAATANAAAPQAPTIIQVGNTRYTHVVKRGEYLSKIAAAWLGDADRWPEICALNKHRHFKTGGKLRDCNLIYPGWDLKLPADARPPATAKPAAPPAPQPRTPAAAPPAAATPPAAAPSHVPAPAAPTSPAQSAPASASPDRTHTAPAPQAPAARHDGLTLPDGSWIPWALAAAITAASAMVWLQRRRRYIPGTEDDLTELPTPVTNIGTQVRRNPDLPMPVDTIALATTVPPQQTPPAGGIGLTGDGAHSAARAALITALAAGSPEHPDARAEVIIDAATLANLIGADAVTLGPWPRLHIADNVDDALTIAESQLLHRSRILDEHAATDLDELRRTAPDEETLPPLLLLCEAPPPGARMRAKVTFSLGERLDLTALLLGEWAHGATIDVAADGRTTTTANTLDRPLPDPMAVMQPDTAVAVLTTLREAHTGQPTITPAQPPCPAIPATDETPEAQPQPLQVITSTADRTTGKARLRVLGAPHIEDPSRALRTGALELAVFLAVHPDGMATRDIGEQLEPDSRVNQADQLVHTNASNLRLSLARPGHAAKGAYVIKTAGRYRLDPANVDVDLWQLRDLLRAARPATADTRRRLLQQACDVYTGPLAADRDYEWITPYRETARRWATEAHLLLAEDLLTDDPQAASDLLDRAIKHDEYNEQLYRLAMRARHALGDPDGIRALLRALAKALTELDAEPSEETQVLAQQLRISLQRR
ncbi:BTAD domain-containing putative transcriptional regulator [Catellatospora chokoriensis]|uniref:LysM domain-containing protein n=1 Tax=Catellatospora chokoriensis TaxID=310353 RepID=A0A8J3JYZ1_9ACTN|nr:BTAD domain-containing putative transcriptional regulator [Catellatospora chokoriensis]GIF89791.1 hypothetical protein Cch02nite_32350 [Catellatospora chokoriensis]